MSEDPAIPAVQPVIPAERPSRTDAVRDVVTAVRSAVILGGSLLVTWTVGLFVRFYIPRYLGPAAFGDFSFADNFAATVFVVLGLGVDTYIQKEIPVRPEHASDFVGALLGVRVIMSFGLFASMAVFLLLTGCSHQVQVAIYIFGVSQFLVATNNMLAALLQASRTVGGLALVNVGSKILWGLGTLTALVLHAGFVGLAIAFLVSEGVKAAALFMLSRKHLHLVLRHDLGAVRRVVTDALPYYLNSIAVTVYAKIDVTILKFISSESEVGWYGSAQNLSSIAMLLSPLMFSVLTPMLSRAASRSEEELTGFLRRTIEMVLSIAIPVSLMMGIGADVWVRYAFGKAFTPAVLSVAILAPMFVLTYLAIILCVFLNLINRPWTVTIVSLTALTVDPLLNVVMVPRALRWYGLGGAGIGASTALVVTECFVVAALICLVGVRCFDRRNLLVIAKSVTAALMVTLLDYVFRWLGPARLLIDAAVYTMLVVLSGALNVKEMLGVLKSVRRPSPT